jgi:hypothetical protein
MGNVLSNTNPEQQARNAATGLITNQDYLRNLANENQTFTPSLASNDAFLTNLQPNLRPKFINDTDFQTWVKGVSNAAGTTAAATAQGYVDTTYDTNIKKYITDQDFATKQYADASQVQLNQWIQNFQPAKEKDLGDLSGKFSTLSTNYTNDKAGFNNQIANLNNNLTSLDTSFNSFKANPAVTGQLQTPGSGFKISGQSRWEFKEDSTGRLCLNINDNPIACIQSNGDLVPPGQSITTTTQPTLTQQSSGTLTQKLSEQFKYTTLPHQSRLRNRYYQY